ncbi:MarR family winged helix-turn-helix transcriptional regulator [Pareuzebyella sediminis]|uniref:MarR family winged helix-turn-helix transcriptional regulator n=1 Tax=Pareuzebyella sediminis TaxID=2607998 RepID=UPI0011EC47FC|nr:winged helix DNA-binding protein [Pareuzebyella sediminis]
MKYTLLKELIKYAEEYQEGNSSNKIEDFTIWLNNKLFTSQNNGSHSTHDELLIAFKLMHLNKALKKQTKSVLSESNVSSIDEYSFLLHLDYQESFRKMELVEIHNLEAPTGIEIIKRLIKNKFLEEFPDEEDKRAKRIKITKNGIKELRLIKPKIDLIFTRFTEPLNLNEKVKISGILDKLIR